VTAMLAAKATAAATVITMPNVKAVVVPDAPTSGAVIPPSARREVPSREAAVPAMRG